ncbi:lytic transglycosylase domain-containing protein [Paenibacillus sp. NEAU-GSW1]|uniref:lytic transglycosylase domain-containing protein n=1 Tax=Paenibacillus sp. NEAU-GSW1 TaxID=2682486 RepID=UPI0012E23B37|nr:lytic transglycosylase domain-containing protein [Paenibacillus sp. NEAU-GSW1]MUT65813.1 transglycosylase SLT domain-containing protein [Paenibacillus sp. NEAU-GSW1]
MRRLLKKRVFLVLVIGFVAVMFLNSDWIARWMYPIQYKEDIRASSSNYNVEPHLVAAIIRAETNFSNGKVSPKGALGLMQIMPETAEWVIDKAGFEEVTPEMLQHRPDVSIEIGTWYLNSLHKQFGQNKVAAIAAYNAGPGNVRKWLDSGRWDGKAESVNRIPFGETRHYVQRVIYYYNKYKELYPTL